MSESDDALETMRHLYIEGVQEALHSRGFKLAVRIPSPFNRGPVSSARMLDGLRRGPFVARLASDLLLDGLSDEGVNRVMAALRAPMKSFLDPIRQMRILKGIHEKAALASIDTAIRDDLKAWESSSGIPDGFGAWLALYDPPPDEVVASTLCSAVSSLSQSLPALEAAVTAPGRDEALAAIDRLISSTQASINALRQVCHGEVGVEAFKITASAAKLPPVLEQFRLGFMPGGSRVGWTTVSQAYILWAEDFTAAVRAAEPRLEQLGFYCD